MCSHRVVNRARDETRGGLKAACPTDGRGLTSAKRLTPDTTSRLAHPCLTPGPLTRVRFVAARVLVLLLLCNATINYWQALTHLYGQQCRQAVERRHHQPLRLLSLDLGLGHLAGT